MNEVIYLKNILEFLLVLLFPEIYGYTDPFRLKFLGFNTEQEH